MINNEKHVDNIVDVCPFSDGNKVLSLRLTAPSALTGMGSVLERFCHQYGPTAVMLGQVSHCLLFSVVCISRYP